MATCHWRSSNPTPFPAILVIADHAAMCRMDGERIYLRTLSWILIGYWLLWL